MKIHHFKLGMLAQKVLIPLPFLLQQPSQILDGFALLAAKALFNHTQAVIDRSLQAFDDLLDGVQSFLVTIVV